MGHLERLGRNGWVETERLDWDGTIGLGRTIGTVGQGERGRAVFLSTGSQEADFIHRFPAAVS